MFIMAILGGILIWKHGKSVVWEGGAKTFSLLSLCIWVPIVLSVPDSLWFQKSLSTALTHPRIYLAGIYPQFASKGDPFMSPDGTGPIYAHQMVLEVGTETGVIGLAGLVAFFAFFVQAGRGLSRHPLAWAAWVGTFAWLFPINTHTALYSAYWSLLVGWLVAVLSARGGTTGWDS